MNDIYEMPRNSEMNLNEYTIGINDDHVKEILFKLLGCLSKEAVAVKDDHGGIMFEIREVWDETKAVVQDTQL